MEYYWLYVSHQLYLINQPLGKIFSLLKEEEIGIKIGLSPLSVIPLSHWIEFSFQNVNALIESFVKLLQIRRKLISFFFFFVKKCLCGCGCSQPQVILMIAMYSTFLGPCGLKHRWGPPHNLPERRLDIVFPCFLHRRNPRQTEVKKWVAQV